MDDPDRVLLPITAFAMGMVVTVALIAVVAILYIEIERRFSGRSDQGAGDG